MKKIVVLSIIFTVFFLFIMSELEAKMLPIKAELREIDIALERFCGTTAVDENTSCMMQAVGAGVDITVGLDNIYYLEEGKLYTLPRSFNFFDVVYLYKYEEIVLGLQKLTNELKSGNSYTKSIVMTYEI